MTDVDTVSDLVTALGESPVWDEDGATLHLVDIVAERIHEVDPATGEFSTIQLERPPGAVALRTDGGYVAALARTFSFVDRDGQVRVCERVDRGDRMNDGKCDPVGRFVAGTLDGQERPRAGLYQLGPEGVRQLLADVSLSNGLGWSPDGALLYYVDTTTERIDVLDYDVSTGDAANRRPFVDLHEVRGRPDGLTVDREGGVWVAMARGGSLRRYAPSGALDAVIELPTAMVTSCTFGGPRLDELFVTTTRALLHEDLRSADPLAGRLFVVTDVGIAGLPPVRYPDTGHG